MRRKKLQNSCILQKIDTDASHEFYENSFKSFFVSPHATRRIRRILDPSIHFREIHFGKFYIRGCKFIVLEHSEKNMIAVLLSAFETHSLKSSG
jgi:hypothetical protein